MHQLDSEERVIKWLDCIYYLYIYSHFLEPMYVTKSLCRRESTGIENLINCHPKIAHHDQDASKNNFFTENTLKNFDPPHGNR